METSAKIYFFPKLANPKFHCQDHLDTLDNKCGNYGHLLAMLIVTKKVIKISK